MSFFHCRKDGPVLIERMLYNGVDIFKYDHRRAHVDGEYRSCSLWRYVDESLLFYCF